MRPSILIVDDEPEVLNSLERVLKNDFIIHTFNSAIEALSFFSLNPTHLVISDMRMPEMAGEDFLAEIRKLNQFTKCCVLTGYADLDEAEKAINEASAVAYFSKPWNNQELKAKLKELTIGLVAIQKQHRKIKHLNKSKNIAQLNMETMGNVIMEIISEQEQRHKVLESKELAVRQLLTLLSTLSATFLNDQQGHEHRVAEQAKQLAKIMGLNEKQSVDIYISALLYRIGLLGIDKGLLVKPRSLYTYDEMRLFQNSFKLSAQYMEIVDILKPSAHIVKYLYEQVEDHKKQTKPHQETTPLGSKILRVVILFDEIVSGLTTGNKVIPDRAMVTIKKYCQSHIDSKVLYHFIEMMNNKEYSFERACSLCELREGMVLAHDVINEGNIKLLVEGAVLTNENINRMKVIEENSSRTIIVYVKDNKRSSEQVHD